MDQITIALSAIAAMLVLLAIGTPVAIAMISVSFVGLWLSAGLHFSLTQFMTLPYAAASSFSFAAIPTFVAMGIVFGKSGLAANLFRTADMWLAQIRGGLYMAVIVASAAFGAINGSTVVGSALFTKIALPEMVKLKYDKAASAGCIVGAGTFSAMIPPSITMVLYGLLTDESIGKILIAGILPGILTAVVYLIGVAVLVRAFPFWAPPPNRSFSSRQKLSSLVTLVPVMIVFLTIIGGIYSGLVAPASAGAIGATCAVLIALAMRKMAARDYASAMKETASTTAVLFFIVIGGLALSRLLLVTGSVDVILEAIRSSGLSPWHVMVIIVLIYLVLGCLMDSISMMVMTVPIVHPIVVGLGFDPIWFAIIMVKLIELSVITPPIGLNLFAVQSSSNGLVTTGEVFKGVIPFIVLEIIVLVALCLVPGIATLLPNLMMK